MLRVVNILLLLAALLGGCLAIQAGREHQRLRAEHRGLKAEVGLVSVTDPDKIHIVAIPTGDPLDLAWQTYMPANSVVQWRAKYQGGGSSSSMGGSTNQEAYFDLVRVRLREPSPGRPEIWFKQRNGSSLSGFSPAEYKRIKDSKVKIETLGVEKMAVINRDEVMTLFRVTDLQTPGKEPLMEIRCGTQEAFAKEHEQ